MNTQQVTVRIMRSFHLEVVVTPTRMSEGNRGCGRNPGRILFVKVVYSDEQRRLALRVFRRTRSVTKTVCEFGVSGTLDVVPVVA